ncbi:rhomboid family intramembrane serine protease GlpG [Alteromonadaceae bacterium M269]|nr:rhomboid family intramembrane serine protease GlpG [Alteromonadaceae bacterium M269]
MTEPSILIGFQYESHARLLIHFMKSKGLDVGYCVMEGEYGHGVALNNLSQKETAEACVSEFLSASDHKELQRQAWESGETVKLNTTHQFDWLSLKGGLLTTPITGLIILLCLAVYFASLLGWHWDIFRSLSMQSFAALTESGQWWRLLGPAFFHFGALHIIFNLLWWWTLGRQIEIKLGTSSLLLIFLTTAVVSNLIQYALSGPNFGGLSGVVYGLVGFVWWIGWLKPSWGINLPKPIVGFMLVWLVLGYADLLWVDMANEAHTSGLISGCLLAFIWSRLASEKSGK